MKSYLLKFTGVYQELHTSELSVREVTETPTRKRNVNKIFPFCDST